MSYLQKSSSHPPYPLVLPLSFPGAAAIKTIKTANWLNRTTEINFTLVLEARVQDQSWQSWFLRKLWALFGPSPLPLVGLLAVVGVWNHHPISALVFSWGSLCGCLCHISLCLFFFFHKDTSHFEGRAHPTPARLQLNTSAMTPFPNKAKFWGTGELGPYMNWFRGWGHNSTHNNSQPLPQLSSLAAADLCFQVHNCSFFRMSCK